MVLGFVYIINISDGKKWHDLMKKSIVSIVVLPSIIIPLLWRRLNQSGFIQHEIVRYINYSNEFHKSSFVVKCRFKHYNICSLSIYFWITYDIWCWVSNITYHILVSYYTCHSFWHIVFILVSPVLKYVYQKRYYHILGKTWTFAVKFITLRVKNSWNIISYVKI